MRSVLMLLRLTPFLIVLALGGDSHKMGVTQKAFVFGFVILLAGCASASVMDLDANTVQVSAGTAPACGAVGAQRFAVKTAAYETLKRGYDRYVIVGAQGSAHDRLAGFTPMQANSYGSGTYSNYGNTGSYNGYTNTTITGGQPIVLTEHGQDLVIKMFHENDPVGANAVDAKSTLGPKWQEILLKGPGITCT